VDIRKATNNGKKAGFVVFAHCVVRSWTAKCLQ
jgi:hypothetical protein